MTIADGEESREQVIAGASGLGYLVTPTQLARWHRAGLIPRPRQQALGRGRGTVTTYPAGTAAQVIAICQIKDDERRLDRIAFRLWWEGFDVDHSLIREQLQAALLTVEADFQHEGREPRGRSSGTETLMRRSFGPRRLTAMIAAAQRPASDDANTPINWDAPWPPRLDDLAESIGQLVASRVTGTNAAELLAGATHEDLITARERTRSLLTQMQNILAPLSWLYGKGGEAFRIMDRLLRNLTPHDYVGLVALTALLAPALPPDTLIALDANTEPPLAEELRLILAIRDQVPDAAAVFTPMAVRACLRDKEAARRYKPGIEQFVATHREEVNVVLAAVFGQLADTVP